MTAYAGHDIPELSPEQREVLLDERERLRTWLHTPETQIMLSRLSDMGKSLLASYDNVNLLDPLAKVKVPLPSGKMIDLSAYEIQITRKVIGAILPTILEGIANFEIDTEEQEPWTWAGWLKKARRYCSERLEFVLKLGRRR